jgi:electron transfer flavoprotein alpha subunit
MSDISPPPAVVHVLATEQARGEWEPVAWELLGDARTLASRLNGRVAAWVPQATDAAAGDDDALHRHGADIVTRLVHARFASWSSEAIAAALAAHLPAECRLALLPGHARGEEVAALLAERLGTPWIHSTLSLAVTRSGAIEATTVSDSGRLSRCQRVAAEGAVVATMAPGVGEAHVRRPIAELVRETTVPDLSHVPELTRVEAYLPADPQTMDLRHARRIVAAGRGAGGPEGVELVRKLAAALGASLAASRVAVDLGWVEARRQIGQTGWSVRPELYLACGISGASHHLAGMRESRTIVALNPDRAAPLHEIAHQSLYGDLRQVIPAVLALLEQRRSAEPHPTVD